MGKRKVRDGEYTEDGIKLRPKGWMDFTSVGFNYCGGGNPNDGYWPTNEDDWACYGHDKWKKYSYFKTGPADREIIKRHKHAKTLTGKVSHAWFTFKEYWAPENKEERKWTEEEVKGSQKIDPQPEPATPAPANTPQNTQQHASNMVNQPNYDMIHTEVRRTNQTGDDFIKHMESKGYPINDRMREIAKTYDDACAEKAQSIYDMEYKKWTAAEEKAQAEEREQCEAEDRKRKREESVGEDPKKTKTGETPTSEEQKPEDIPLPGTDDDPMTDGEEEEGSKGWGAPQSNPPGNAHMPTTEPPPKVTQNHQGAGSGTEQDFLPIDHEIYKPFPEYKNVVLPFTYGKTYSLNSTQNTVAITFRLNSPIDVISTFQTTTDATPAADTMDTINQTAQYVNFYSQLYRYWAVYKTEYKITAVASATNAAREWSVWTSHHGAQPPPQTNAATVATVPDFYRQLHPHCHKKSIIPDYATNMVTPTKKHSWTGIYKPGEDYVSSDVMEDNLHQTWHNWTTVPQLQEKCTVIVQRSDLPQDPLSSTGEGFRLFIEVRYHVQVRDPVDVIRFPTVTQAFPNIGSYWATEVNTNQDNTTSGWGNTS
ncbi:Aste57867_19907 [Aphanomyces stellatus]|uniref:Aste57867_19907 protein n=1 Tax=Aphanomyces stellatus TaxID=120398 RepID=A0A485LEB0_9STRA|nr:hypothetical protein As57867_019841 [Aphanomyces stellatus]VFT96605.1 Aste57867_19907 [Aphanomyces stellatus]